MTRVEVPMGNVRVSSGGETLTASGIGSCLVIILWDPVCRAGGLAHAMLPPASRPPGRDGQDTRYTDAAIDETLRQMLAGGSRGEHLEAKIVGGANMFPNLKADLGSENIHSAKEKLDRENIRLVGESVGGSVGRCAEFCTASGIVTVKVKF